MKRRNRPLADDGAVLREAAPHHAAHPVLVHGARAVLGVQHVTQVHEAVFVGGGGEAGGGQGLLRFSKPRAAAVVVICRSNSSSVMRENSPGPPISLRSMNHPSSRAMSTSALRLSAVLTCSCPSGEGGHGQLVQHPLPRDRGPVRRHGLQLGHARPHLRATHQARGVLIAGGYSPRRHSSGWQRCRPRGRGRSARGVGCAGSPSTCRRVQAAGHVAGGVRLCSAVARSSDPCWPETEQMKSRL